MEKVIEFSFDLVSLMLYVFLIIYFFRNKKFYTYVKGMFLTCFFFRIIGMIFQILMYTFSVESIRDIFGYYGTFHFIPNSINYISYFLLLFGLTLLVGKDYPIKNEKTEYPTMQGKRRNIGVSLLLFVVTLGIYTPFWLYRTVKDLKNNFEDDIPYTPGKAVGFMFIPLFNFFWALYILFSLPSRIKRIEDKYYGENVGFYFHPLLISILLIIFMITADLQFYVEFGRYILYAESAILVLWLTIQAKLNSFFDFKKSLL